MAKIKSNDTLLSRLVPFGLVGRTKPQHYREMLGVIWENRKEIPYAWNVLNHGVCDGCSLGPYGLRDNVLDGTHLCMTRLKLLKLNTMAALDMAPGIVWSKALVAASAAIAVFASAAALLIFWWIAFLRKVFMLLSVAGGAGLRLEPLRRFRASCL